jgi:hypothetical protein
MNSDRMPVIITTLSMLILGEAIMCSYSAVGVEMTTSSIWRDWCYISAFPEDRPVCFPSHEECKKAESSDRFKSDTCFNHKS